MTGAWGGAETAVRFGRYEVVRRLGSGGMAEVFEARHADLGKRVALKVVHPAIATDDRAVRAILREGRAAAAVHHPHVVEVLDVGTREGTPYLVMEFLDGEDLGDLLRREGPLSPERIAELLLPVVSGMIAAHAAGIVHRDLKPSNIFLARRHRGTEPVVIDFGISRGYGPQHSQGTSSRLVAGTAPYMAPEQLRDTAEASPKSDQYAIGVVLYECATGGTPFWDEDLYELLHAIMTAPVVAPSALNPHLPAAFDALVLRALSRDPGERFPDLAALGAALLSFAAPETRSRWAAEFSRSDGAAAGASDSRGSAGDVKWAPAGRAATSRLWRRMAILGGGAVAAIAAGLSFASLPPSTGAPRPAASAAAPVAAAPATAAPPVAALPSQGVPERAAPVVADARAVAPAEAAPVRGAEPADAPQASALPRAVTDRARAPAVPARSPAKRASAGPPSPGSSTAPPSVEPRPAGSHVELGTANIPIVE
jgi:serine/threonine-protein kinase